jgi:hypothetical protein
VYVADLHLAKWNPGSHEGENIGEDRSMESFPLTIVLISIGMDLKFFQDLHQGRLMLEMVNQ